MRYFHGVKNRKNYFEGWYFKHQKNNQYLAFIPSVSVDEKGVVKASLQILNQEKSWDLEYPICEFNSEEEQLSIRMDNSYFTERGCTLNIKEEDLLLKGRIDYGPLLMLDKSIMGPFRYVPKMECMHEIISLYHNLEGKIEINGTIINFDDGIGYIEMDRGSSFPKDYVWTHTTWKDENENSIVVAAASIPYLGLSFKGCLSCMMVDGKRIVLATYYGAKVKQMNEDVIVIHQKGYRLEIECLDGNKIDLKAPMKGEMNQIVKERLLSTVRYRLFENNDCIFDVTKKASFEARLSK